MGGEKSIASIKHAVVIAGGGPTGLMLAGELALAGVDVAIVERRLDRELVGLRAGGLHSRTLELFDQRGIADRFLAEGQVHRMGMSFRMTPVDISDFPSRHSYFLSLWQQQIECILANWVDELGVRIYRGCEVAGFAQDDSGVDVALSDSTSMRAEYLAGCDGGRRYRNTFVLIESLDGLLRYLKVALGGVLGRLELVGDSGEGGDRESFQ